MRLLLALCGGLSVFFLFVAFITARRQAGTETVKKRVQSLQDSEGRQALLDEQMRNSFFRRIINPFFDKIRRALMKLTPQALYGIAIRKTSAAGGSYQWGVEGFIVYWTIVSGLAVLLMLFYLLVDPAPLSKRVAVFFLGTAFGVYFPIFLVNIRIRRRRKQILAQLPDMLDLLCVSVQAGLSFDAALRRVTDRMKGPLIEECVLMLQEVRFGMTRRQALERLSDRCEMQEISLWTAAIIQADKLGVSLGDIMIIQADNMRESRRQYVKKLAQQAPIKMLLPLAVFIFPAMFVVVLLPTLLAMAASFGELTGK